MSDWTPLEKEMRGMRPREVRGELVEEIAGRMGDGSRMADWCLAGAMGSGMAALVVIGVMLWVQDATSEVGGGGGAAGPVMVVEGREGPRVGDWAMAMARAEGGLDGVR